MNAEVMEKVRAVLLAVREGIDEIEFSAAAGSPTETLARESLYKLDEAWRLLAPPQPAPQPQLQALSETAALTQTAPADVADDGPDGMLALAIAVREGKWPHTMDARIWAREWAETLAKRPDIPQDGGTMIAWFASAIMAGYDTAQMRRAPAGVEAEALRRDAERYRWLRENVTLSSKSNYLSATRLSNADMRRVYRLEWYSACNGDLEEIIDAALQSAAGKTEGAK